MLSNLLIQVIPVVGVAFFASSFHFKSRRNILLVQNISLVLLAIHFYLLSATTGVIMSLCNVLFTSFLIFKSKYKIISSKGFLVFAVITLLIATVLTWEGFHSIFAFLGLVSITTAKWQDQQQAIRKFSIPASIFWIFYDGFVGSYGGIVSEIVIMSSIYISFYRNREASQNEVAQ